MKIMVYLALPLMLTDWADCYVSAGYNNGDIIGEVKMLVIRAQDSVSTCGQQICKNDIQKYMNVFFEITTTTMTTTTTTTLHHIQSLHA